MSPLGMTAVVWSFSIAGLNVGDELIKVNGRAVANLKLEEIPRYFYRKGGSVLKLQVSRNGMVFNCKLKLKKIVD